MESKTLAYKDTFKERRFRPGLILGNRLRKTPTAKNMYRNSRDYMQSRETDEGRNLFFQFFKKSSLIKLMMQRVQLLVYLVIWGKNRHLYYK